ncbi:hypothetical protein L2E82_14751 [Cichorium intybus]|uniref:Uncharacterized protein n=1 Tax=Cichorium intybus TaxID=13427 RepID=A0ACB9F093_CICIN|nr:hypothetical protein L2E82_14751 [Cichorium intybus]
MSAKPTLPPAAGGAAAAAPERRLAIATAAHLRCFPPPAPANEKSSREKNLSLSASARAGANGDLCMNHILAPLIDSFVPVRLLSMLFVSVATSERSGPYRPLKFLEDWSNYGRP